MDGWKTGLIVAGSVVGGLAVLWPLGIAYEVSKCERPKYEVIRPLGSKRNWWNGRSPAELRAYAPVLVAEVAVSGTMRQASSAGFRKIANFIFGNNSRVVPASGGAGAAAAAAQGSEKIAMTSPVVMDFAASSSSEKIAMTAPVVMGMVGGSEAAPDDTPGDVRMSFVMPSKYTLDTLPRPNNPDVSIKQVPAHTAAALQFRGHIRGRRVVEQKKQELLALLEAEGLVPVGDLQLLQYHPPFTWGWQRVNEVLYRVADKAAAAKKK